MNFILGPYGSPNTATAAAVAERLKVPMVEGNGAAESIFSQGYKYTFAVLAPGRRYLEGVLEMALKQKNPPKTVAIATANDAFSVEVGQGAANYAVAHHMTVVYNNKYPANATDVSAVVSAIKAANPDVILNGGHLGEALLLHRTFKEQNVNAKIYAYSVGPDTPDFRKTLGKDADYVFGGTQWSPTAKYKGEPGSSATPKSTPAAFKKKYGHIPDYHNAESTAACLAFQYAIEKAGSLDPQKVRDALADARRRDVLRALEVRQPRDQRLQADGGQPDPEGRAQNGLAVGRPGRAADVPDAALEPAHLTRAALSRKISSTVYSLAGSLPWSRSGSASSGAS